jgi:hypothetical protein
MGKLFKRVGTRRLHATRRSAYSFFVEVYTTAKAERKTNENLRLASLKAL